MWAVPPLRPDEAARLFAERARARRPGFVATGGERELMERICGRLEGIPLAIELLTSARLAGRQTQDECQPGTPGRPGL